MIDFTGSHFEKAISLWGIRWSVASPISDRPWEERMQERGVHVEYATLTRGGLN
jgi:putative transposase